MSDIDGGEIERDITAIRREIGGSGEVADVETEDPGPPINEPFDPEKIDVVTRTPTVSLLLSRIRKGTIDLAPDFQRHAGIWRDVNQSRLIESLLLRIPLPTFYAAESAADDSWAIVDGIQRLTAITRFIDPDSSAFKPLTLQGLDYLDFEGFRFEDLPGRLQTRLEETEVVLHLIRRGTPEEVKFNIFARINTGGVPLSSQELRHALIPGQGRELLSELAQSLSFKRATLGTVGSSRMADREMILRFAAFLMTKPPLYSHQDFDLFLRVAMKNINDLTTSGIIDLKKKFRRAMDTAHEIFGKYAFRKQYEVNSSRYPINKALFETVAVTLAERNTKQLNELVKQSEDVNLAFIELLTSDPQFERAISVGTGDVAKVRYRFQSMDELFSEFDGSS
ncbi:DUF262 domain-containing protein [Kribbella sp. CA-293567]|uniref:DUF262 domain-containing protein n=1 Tax=Kribbella sp. CA-293567 TaxID=3002436 RepID=UPI0022DD9445|nr:DUF262 domain-containing protein [Kribbella sp. CA-293567]WBQ04148.1 DUF262 domain-containing protein [Kribbella sp. CA-293567]